MIDWSMIYDNEDSDESKQRMILREIAEQLDRIANALETKVTEGSS